MPYPESCPECGGGFRNTGTHFTARRNEVGRHVLLELGCQNTSRRFWWDFTTGSASEDGGRTVPDRRAASLAVSGAAVSSGNGALHAERNGHGPVSTLDRRIAAMVEPQPEIMPEPQEAEPEPQAEPAHVTHDQTNRNGAEPHPAPDEQWPTAALREAFVRQLQIDRLTLRQMRSWLMSDEARRAIEVAAGATEGTYERLALILFGVELPRLLGKQPSAAASNGMSAEERLELQREKARIRARLRRAAAKAGRQPT